MYLLFPFDDTININNLDRDLKIDKKSNENILIYRIGHVTMKDLTCANINGVNTLYLNIDKINGYIEENNWKKCLTLVPSEEGKDILKMHEKLWYKSKDLIESQ